MIPDVSSSGLVRPVSPTTDGVASHGPVRRSGYFASDGWESEQSFLSASCTWLTSLGCLVLNWRSPQVMLPPPDESGSRFQDECRQLISAWTPWLHRVDSHHDLTP